jgi:toxin-antitoxin system PIN domain toxin
VRALLDVNVLVALLDEAHIHHQEATAWLARNLRQGWASCPMTQNGCLRILSLPGYLNRQPPAEVAARLAEATAGPAHAFWEDSLSLLDRPRIRWDHVLGARQITDVYLLALAVAREGCLVTFDRSISLTAVQGATRRNLYVLGT